MSIVRSKWFLGALLALPMVIAPAVVALSIRAPVELPIVARRSVASKNEIAAERRRQAFADEARQRALARYNTWQGTQLYGRGTDDPVARAFNSDPPAPEGRLREFSAYLGEAPLYKVVGWRAGVVSTTPNDHGWKVTVRVNPTLASLRGGVPFTSYETIETWQIGKNGSATALNVLPGDKPHFLMVD